MSTPLQPEDGMSTPLRPERNPRLFSLSPAELRTIDRALCVAAASYDAENDPNEAQDCREIMNRVGAYLASLMTKAEDNGDNPLDDGDRVLDNGDNLLDDGNWVLDK